MDKKVIITYYNDEGEVSFETVWAQIKEENIYQIKNIPFFASNISFNDIVEVEDDDGQLYINKIKEVSLHSTIQIVFLDKSKKGEVINQLESIGCSWEGMHNQDYLALDVKPSLNYTLIKSYLDDLFNLDILDYKEANLSEKHDRDLNKNPPTSTSFNK